MQIKIDVEFFECEPQIVPHLQRVFDGEYEIPVLYVNDAPTILDLGANYGAFSIWASHRWPGCRIHAFEPHPETFAGLKHNLRFYKNVTPHNYAVGEGDVRILNDGLANSGERSLHPISNNPNPTGVHVEMFPPLSLPEARIIKLDIEGSEMEVLKPLIESGRKFDAIMVETHNRSLRRRVEDLLAKDYVLTGAHCYSADLGVFRFVRGELI